jgi:hypothetical protein
VILEGLPSDYAPVVSVIESRFDLLDLDEVEVLLIAHELRLNKFKTQTVIDVASLNLTHAAPPPSPTAPDEGSSSTLKPETSPSDESDYNFFVVAGGEAVVEAVEAVVVTLIYSARCAPRLVTVL